MNIDQYEDIIDVQLIKWFLDINNEYIEKYLKIVLFAKQRIISDELSEKNYNRNNSKYFVESHHIVPKFIFKSNKLKINNSKKNLVIVTYEEHFQLHLLLAMNYFNNNINYFYKAWSTIQFMFPNIKYTDAINNQEYYKKLYNKLRIKFINYIKSNDYKNKHVLNSRNSKVYINPITFKKTKIKNGYKIPDGFIEIKQYIYNLYYPVYLLFKKYQEIGYNPKQIFEKLKIEMPQINKYPYTINNSNQMMAQFRHHIKEYTPKHLYKRSIEDIRIIYNYSKTHSFEETINKFIDTSYLKMDPIHYLTNMFGKLPEYKKTKNNFKNNDLQIIYDDWKIDEDFDRIIKKYNQYSLSKTQLIQIFRKKIPEYKSRSTYKNHKVYSNNELKKLYELYINYGFKYIKDNNLYSSNEKSFKKLLINHKFNLIN